MKILEKLDKLTDLLSQYPLPRDITNLYNEVIKDLELYFSIQNSSNYPFEDKQLKELWQEFERQRYEISGKRYTEKARQIAINKIYEFAGKDWKKFKTVVEWAIALGYPDITPQILDYITPKEGKLFRESKYADFREFIWFFRNKEYYLTADFRHYYERIWSWSEAKNVRKKHWGYAALMIIEKDVMAGKLIKISPEQRQKETISGDKLQKLWQKIISESTIDPQDKNIIIEIKPLELYRFVLTLQATPEQNNTLENNIDKVKHLLLKNNIRNITYKIIEK